MRITFALNEADENDPFGRNIQAANLAPKSICNEFFHSLEFRKVYINTTLNCVAFALCARGLFILISKNDLFCFIKVNNVTKQLQ